MTSRSSNNQGTHHPTLRGQNFSRFQILRLQQFLFFSRDFIFVFVIFVFVLSWQQMSRISKFAFFYPPICSLCCASNAIQPFQCTPVHVHPYTNTPTQAIPCKHFNSHTHATDIFLFYFPNCLLISMFAHRWCRLGFFLPPFAAARIRSSVSQRVAPL